MKAIKVITKLDGKRWNVRNFKVEDDAYEYMMGCEKDYEIKGWALSGCSDGSINLTKRMGQKTSFIKLELKK